MKEKEHTIISCLCFTAPFALQVRWWGEAGASAQTLLTNEIRLRRLDFKAVIKVSFYLIAVGFDCCRARLHSRSVWKQWRKPKDKGVCAWLCVCVRVFEWTKGGQVRGSWEWRVRMRGVWGWRSHTGRGHWCGQRDCALTMSQSTNRPCMTGLGQQLMAPNYSFSVLQKAAADAWPPEMSLPHKCTKQLTCLESRKVYFYHSFPSSKCRIKRSWDDWAVWARGLRWGLGKGGKKNQDIEREEGPGWGGQTDVSPWRDIFFFPTGCLLRSGLMWCWRDRDVRMN